MLFDILISLQKDMNITADNQYLQAVVKRLFSRSSQYIVLQIVSYTEIKDRSGFTPRRSGVRVPHRPLEIPSTNEGIFVFT